MAIQELNLGRGVDFTPLNTIASLSRNRTLQEQETQQNALQLQRLALQLQESKKKADEETAVKKIISEGGEPQAVYQKLLSVNPDTARTYLTNARADEAATRNEALQNLQLTANQPGPMQSVPRVPVQVSAPQPQPSPIQTTLPGTGAAPAMSTPTQPSPLMQSVSLPNRWQPTPTRTVSIPSATGGAPVTVEQPYLEEATRRAQATAQAAEQFKTNEAIRAKLAEPITTPKEATTTIGFGTPQQTTIKGQGETKPLKFNSNAATGGLETIEDPNSGAVYHAGNITAAPPEVKAAWDSIQGQQAAQRSYKETEQGKRDQALMDRQTVSFQNAIAKSQFDSAQKVVASADTDYQSALDRVKTMERNKAAALKGDQQAMLSLLTNHIGMTMGAQKGARITQAILQEAQNSMPWLEKLESKFDGRGILSGVTLGPQQMQFMVNLAHEKADDLLDHKQRVESEYHDALGVGRRPSAKPATNDPLGIR